MAEGSRLPIFAYSFFYYLDEAEIEIAQEIVDGIIDSTIELDKNPLIGQKEQFLLERSREFRYLIHRNYKIIYWINEKKKRIKIANIFDCGQNPIKMDETERK